MWNTFEQVREKLSNQYVIENFAPQSGMASDALQQKLQFYFDKHRTQTHIRVKSQLFKIFLENARVRIDSEDWFADHIEGTHLLKKYTDVWRKENPSGRENISFTNRRNGIGYAKLDLSHTCPDWKNLRDLGISGLRDRALQAARNSHGEALEFYQAVATVYDAMRTFVLRLAEQAQKVNAFRVITALRNLADAPPKTFHEALQLAYIYNQLQEIEGELVRSMGPVDQLYLNLYRADITAGRLTLEEAEELIKFFYLKFFAQKQKIGKNFCFGGTDANGNDLSNELTVLGFKAYRDIRTFDPKLSLRITPKTPAKLINQVTACLLEGLTAVVFANDVIGAEMFRQRGKDADEFKDFVLIGCYEPAIGGKEMPCTMEVVFNLAKPVELIFQQNNLPETYAEFEFEYFRHLENILRSLMDDAVQFEKTWQQINPSPLLSGSMTECIKSGRDISCSGTKYNSSGVMCAGIANAADSLIAVKTLVFDKQLCSLSELRDILQNNWEDAPQLRATALKQLPKWGNCMDEPDQTARRICDYTAQLINHTPNSRGGHFQMGLWSIDLNAEFGLFTGALPDGRKSGELLSKNLSSSIGMDKSGVTSLINSAAKLDHAAFANGSVLDIMLHPSAVAGSSGKTVIPELIRGYFEQGGFAIQFNIFNAATLKQAQNNPEKFSNLQVRVCGWNVRFIDLDKNSQNAFIAQAERLL